MKNKKLTFILSDESINSHGTWVRTSGIKLDRFKSNPVMLWSHDDNLPPIGKWDNIRVEGEQLLADAVFDESDSLAAAIKSKVEQGLLKACSIGFYATKYSSDKEDIKAGQRYETIVESELLEASLCAIGSNANAMALYDSKGRRINLSAPEERQACGLKELPQNEDINSKNEDMEALKQEELQAKYAAQEQELAELKAYKESVEKEAKARRERDVEELVKQGIESRRITKENAAVWKQLATDNYESAKIALEAIMPNTRIEEYLKGSKREASEYAGKSWEELDKAGKLQSLKESDFELFKSLYKSKFGTDYKG